MLQNSNNKNNKKDVDKNLKLMALSGVVLFVLFFYTMFKSSSHIQGSTYYVGLIFVGILLLLALFAKMYKKKINAFVEKTRKKNGRCLHGKRELTPTYGKWVLSNREADTQKAFQNVGTIRV